MVSMMSVRRAMSDDLHPAGGRRGSDWVSSLGESDPRDMRLNHEAASTFLCPAGTHKGRQGRSTSSKALGSLIINVISGYIDIRAAPSARR